MDYPVLELPYPPSNNVYYRHSGHHSYISKEGKAFKIMVMALAHRAQIECIDGPVEVWIVLHPKRNKDGSPNKTRMDLDNCFKAVFDSLIGIAFVDDDQVIRLVAEVGEPVENGGLSVQVKDVANEVYVC